MATRRHELLGCPIDAYSFEEAVVEIVQRIESRQRTNVVHFLNVAKIVQARRNARLREALWAGDLVLADGKPLLPAARSLGVHLATRVNGTDLLEELLGVCEKRAFSVYFLGARPEVLEACVAKVTGRFRNLRIAGYRHGYFARDQETGIVEEINASGTDVLFVGLGTPQKELFVFENRNRLDVPVVQGVGGSFDVLAGFVKRAPRWMQVYGLEWLFRVLQEPRRLGWRYASTNAQFSVMYTRCLLARLWRSRR